MNVIDSVLTQNLMNFIRAMILATIAAIIFFLPKSAYAVDVSMGAGGNLVFEPNEITISAGDTVHFMNQSLPPHNIIVEARPDLSRESLLFAPGETQDVIFADVGDYNFFCGPHQGAGMTGIVHVE
jgi:plastocyanin